MANWWFVSHSCAPGQFDSSSWKLRGSSPPGVLTGWVTTPGLHLLAQFTGALLPAAALVTELCLLGTMGDWHIPYLGPILEKGICPLSQWVRMAAVEHRELGHQARGKEIHL